MPAIDAGQLRRQRITNLAFARLADICNRTQGKCYIMPKMTITDDQGNRLYLNAEERAAFMDATKNAERSLKLFCHVLHHAGCRITEGLELTARRVDVAEQSLRFRSLKKRDGKIVFRNVPVPPALIESLDNVFGIREIQKRGKRDEIDAPLWPWSRVHAWRLVKGIMNDAEIAEGPQKTPKGLRHGFGIYAIQSGIPLNMLQKWLGHADMATTAIYADALGEEERQIAGRMWN
jgi:integrase